MTLNLFEQVVIVVGVNGLAKFGLDLGNVHRLLFGSVDRR